MNERTIMIPTVFAVEESTEFRNKMNELLLYGEKNFSLDFSNCTFIDSTGLGVLVSVYKKCMEREGSLRLHSIKNSQVLKVFRLTRLDSIFDITD